ncbi:hypothetical protein ACHHV8_00050 [Paenibacillus sp. TAB 01]|uniref:hypothetical protein n=1 Tax=Paenibacillus sp. TAB 01 TaxID=3368988 RepID=UPI0037511BB6
MAKKLTITDLIAQKERLKQKKKRTQTLYVESLDAEVVIQEPASSIADEAIEMTQDPQKSDMADVHMVYHTMIEPNLKDAELQKAYGCVADGYCAHAFPLGRNSQL